MALKTIIIDDEPNNIDNLNNLLKNYCPEVEFIFSTEDPLKGVVAIKELKPDLVFLDIQMPGMTGFELLKSLNQDNFEVIFVTAFDHYAIQAIRFAAIDYLLKPINVEELVLAVEKASEKSAEKKKNLRLENLLDLLQQNRNEKNRIALPSLKETRFVKIEDILRCESSNNYTTFYFTNGESLVVSKPIYEYESILNGYNFIRCHQSHLVNKKFVRSWVKEDGGYLLMEDKKQIPVSRLKKELLKQFLF